MERSVIVHPMQQIDAQDYLNMRAFPRASFDHIVKDGIDAGQKYTGFHVAISGPLELTVNSGRYYKNGEIYYADTEGGTRLNFADLLPSVTKKIITVAVWGVAQETAVEPRAFLTNVETGEMEAQAIATESRRVANINLVPGQENANPLAPALQTDVIAIAHVTLTPAGVEEIKMVEENQLSSVQKNLTYIRILEAWKNDAGSQLDTFQTDMANIGSSLRGLARYSEIAEVQSDVARVKRKIEMPDGLSSYAADYFMALEQSSTDADHPDTMAKIEEGCRFPPAKQRVANIELYNPLETQVMKTGNFALPAYDPIRRLHMKGRTGELSLASYTQKTTNIVKKTRTRRRIRYGRTIGYMTYNEDGSPQYVGHLLSNVQPAEGSVRWWQSGNFDPRSGIFKRGNETFQMVKEYYRSTYLGKLYYVRLNHFWEDVTEEAYWDALTHTNTITGSTLAQTWLSAQDGWLTQIGLFFTQVAAAGSVQVMITETTNGAPDLKKVIAHTTLLQSDLKKYPIETVVPIDPVYITKGARYAVVVSSPGAHFMPYIQGISYTQGTLFYLNDGDNFAVADVQKDLAMNIYMARFRQTRVEVQIQPFELENGVVNIDILSTSFVPQGCELIWQVQVGGKWRSLNASDFDALNGLPPLLNARVVFVGTTDLMPSLTFGSDSTVTTSRPRTDFSHVSTVRTMPAAVDSVEVLLRLEGWDGEHHTNECALLIGEDYQTVVSPSTVDEHEAGSPMSIERRYFFDVDDITSYKIRIKGTTDNATAGFYVAERVDRARKVA